MDELDRRIADLKRRDEIAKKEMEGMKTLNFRQRLNIYGDGARREESFKPKHKETFTNYVKKNFPELKTEIDKKYEHYFELLMTDKVKNITDYFTKYGPK